MIEKFKVKFRTISRPVKVIQWNGDINIANEFLGERYGTDWEYMNSESLDIKVPAFHGGNCKCEDYSSCLLGDWIVKYPSGCLKVVTKEAFPLLYEKDD